MVLQLVPHGSELALFIRDRRHVPNTTISPAATKEIQDFGFLTARVGRSPRRDIGIYAVPTWPPSGPKIPVRNADPAA
jgi:hypothetical protein